MEYEISLISMSQLSETGAPQSFTIFTSFEKILPACNDFPVFSAQKFYAKLSTYTFIITVISLNSLLSSNSLISMKLIHWGVNHVSGSQRLDQCLSHLHVSINELVNTYKMAIFDSFNSMANTGSEFLFHWMLITW